MFHLKRFLLLGSLGILLCASLMFTFSPSAHATSCPPTIGIGNQGSWVKVVQNELNAPPRINEPYHVLPLKVDGIFGQLTAEGVENFQIFAHIQVDGIVGPQTWQTSWTAPIT